MQTNKRARHDSDYPNFSGLYCAECEQIAFRIVTVIVNGKAQQKPLCGAHYLQMDHEARKNCGADRDGPMLQLVISAPEVLLDSTRVEAENN
jgi:hypothetical protein